MRKNYRLYSSLAQTEHHPTRAEINLSALRQNYRILREHLCKNGEKTLIAVVKADAYGHGAPACVPILLEEGCRFFAVSCIDEAIAVRTACREKNLSAEILILGFTLPAFADELAEYDLTQALLSEEYALALDSAARAARVSLRTHIAVDTGMNRIGFLAHSEEEISDSADAILRVSRLKNLTLCGMFTHFASADDAEGSPGDLFTQIQAERYTSLRLALESRGVTIPFHHACNSAAALRHPSLHFDGVRPGILLYGAFPSEHFTLPLHPVMRLCTAITHIHKLLPGEGVSYGGDYRAAEERLIATLPIGYADGLLRSMRGATVTVETARGSYSAPLVGRICMDQSMIDITGLPIRVGDTVTVFGNTPQELQTLAAHAGSIPYECLCLVSSRVRRQYLNADESSPAFPSGNEKTNDKTP